MELARRPARRRIADARKKFAELKERTEHITDAELDDFWATVQPATINLMIGEWAGGEFDTDHRANGFMRRLNWFGKGALDGARCLYFYRERV